MTEADGRISYLQFLNAVNDEPTLAPSAKGRRGESGKSRARRIERATESLSNEAAEDLLRTHVAAQVETLLKVSFKEVMRTFKPVIEKYIDIIIIIG